LYVTHEGGIGLKAAIYSRKSKFTGKGESIENQIQLCREYAENQLKHMNIDKFQIYEDEGFSGGNTNRPEFQRLMEDAKAKKFDVLICYRLDRISRNVADFSTTLESLQKHNIDFISIREQFDTSTPMGRAMIYIASVFAQLERETIAERVKDNMLELSKTGRWLGGTVPLGYESNPITYFDQEMNERKMVKLKQVPDELKIVKLIYDKYLELKSLSKVETYLLQNSIRTKRGSDFDKVKLRIILTNPVYVKANNEVMEYLEGQGITTCGEYDGEHGLLSYNKQKGISGENGKITRVYRDKSEWIAAVSSQKGIIEPQDWITVQQTLLINRDKTPNLGKTHNALLTGILRCDKCGSTMQISHGHTSKTGEKHYYYACSLKKFSRGVRCDNKNAKASEVDAVVIKYLKELPLKKKVLLNTLITENKKSKTSSSMRDKETSIRKSILEKEKQIENLMNKLALDDDIADLIISKIKSIKSEIAGLNEELKKIETLNSDIDENALNLSLIKLMLDKCSLIDTLDNDGMKQLMDVLIESATWNGDTQELNIDFIGSKKEDEAKKK
jgi:DNA invertase Pin-like site-specific DNA recombinase